MVFRRVYRYRNLSYIAMGIVAGLVGLALLSFAVSYIVLIAMKLREFSIGGMIVLGVVGFVVGPVFVWVGYKILGRVVRDEHLPVQIDSQGISIGQSNYAWDTVAWIGGKRRFVVGNEYYLLFGYLDGSFVYWIPTNEPLPDDQFEGLMRQVARAGVDAGRIVPTWKQAMFLHW